MRPARAPGRHYAHAARCEPVGVQHVVPSDSNQRRDTGADVSAHPLSSTLGVWTGVVGFLSCEMR
eukprot:6885841-Prymnesium_polylepis.1